MTLSIEPTGWLLGSIAGRPVAAVRMYWPLPVIHEWRAPVPGWVAAPVLLDSGLDWQPATAGDVTGWITAQTAAAAA